MVEDFMRTAVKLSVENIRQGGGPFGAVIIKDGKIIATGVNRVTLNHDPTAHAEICAIRKAGEALLTHNLAGCTIYTSCQPCPMCMAAIYWAHIDELYYGCTAKDAHKIGFDDYFIYEEFKRPETQRKIKTKQVLRDEALKAFDLWEKASDKIRY